MAERHPQLVFAGVAGLLVLALLPALRSPILVFELAAVLVGALIAWKSLVIPLALGGVPPLVDAIAGSDPLPKGGFTFLFSVWIALGLAFAIMRGRQAVAIRALLSVSVLASCFLLGLFLLRLSTSPDVVYGSTKVQLYVADVLIFLFAAVFVGTRGADLRQFFVVLLAVTSAGAILFLFNLVAGYAHPAVGGRFALSAQEYPIELGRDSADGLLIAIYSVLAATRRSARVWAMTVAPALAVAMIAAGSRGPVLAFVFGLAALLALTAVNRRARRRLIFVAGVFLIATIVVPVVVPGSALGRAFSTIIGSASGLSSNGRSQLWSLAITTFSQHPLLGLGTGGFAALNTGLDYPHNILLEVASEVGVFGAAAVIAIVIGFVHALITAWRGGIGQDRLMASLLISLFLTALINACFSDPIQGNGEVWLWGGLAIGMSARLARQRGSARRRSTPSAIL